MLNQLSKLLIFISLISCTLNKSSNKVVIKNKSQKKEAKMSEINESLSKSYAELQVEDLGTIKMHFFESDAPNTVKRITQLISEGFYNGIVFHRVIPGFIAQGGDPTGTGTSGSGQKLKAEFNKQKHIAGTLSMARSSHPDSADSQFYITLDDTPHLDNQYTVFGRVVSGFDQVLKIKQGDKIKSFTYTKL